MTFLTILFFSWFHPFHISVTNIHFKQKEKVVQVEQRIFIDDFEEALRDYSGNQNLDLIESDKKATNELIGAYLSENFEIKANGKRLDLHYLGCEMEIENNVVWCYFEAEKVKKLQEFKVLNSALTEKFKDQENIIHFKSPESGTKSERTGNGKFWVQFESN